jgi:hypothetical protein
MSRQYESMIAGEDLSSHQYKLVKVSAENTVARQTTAGGNIFGVLNNKPENGENATVVVGGATRCFAGGTIAAGNEVSVTASGTATAALSGDYIVGTAISAVASGSNFIMLITQAGYKS